MALAETANLLVNLSLKGNFNQQLSKTQRALGTFDARLDRSESRAFRFGQQIGTGIRRSAALAAGGIAFLALNVQQGLDSLIELEQQTAQTNAAIKSTGGVARVSSAGVGRLAEEFENLNATVGDEFIRSAENMLLSFTNIRGKGFKPALQAVLDLNTGLGKGPEGLTTTALQLGKALQDPVKGLTALRRSGVTFTAEQVKRIKGLVKEGKLLQAQAIIRKEINREFGGRFAAQGRTTAGRIAKFRDSIEDLQRALARALLPTLGNVADALSKTLSDPQVIRSVEEFGRSLATLFSKENLASAAETIGNVVGAIKAALPTIGAGLGAAASVIGTVVSAFQKLPKEVQQLAVGALIANKLTGGIVTNLIGGIAGLFKNFVAAGVNIEAGVVNVAGAGAGGIPAAGVGGVVKTGLTGIQKMFLVGEAVGLIAAVFAVQQAVSSGSSQQAATIRGVQGELITQRPNRAALASALAGVEQGIRDLQSNPLNVLVQGDALAQLQAMASELRLAQQTAKGSPLLEQRHGEQQAGGPVKRAVDATGEKIASGFIGLHQLIGADDSQLHTAIGAAKSSVDTTRTAVAVSGSAIRGQVASSSSSNAATISGATNSSANRIIGAIWAARPIVNVTNVTKTTTIQQRFGNSSGSYGYVKKNIT